MEKYNFSLCLVTHLREFSPPGMISIKISFLLKMVALKATLRQPGAAGQARHNRYAGRTAASLRQYGLRHVLRQRWIDAQMILHFCHAGSVPGGLFRILALGP